MGPIRAEGTKEGTLGVLGGGGGGGVGVGVGLGGGGGAVWGLETVGGVGLGGVWGVGGLETAGGGVLGFGVVGRFFVFGGEKPHFSGCPFLPLVFAT